jgi:site-specific DNA-methyltransferase (adenine-specific)
MNPYYQDSHVTIYHGDCRELLPSLNGVGAVITDPPYSSGGQFRSDRSQKTSVKYVQTEAIDACRAEFSGDNLDQRAFLSWASLWLSQCFRCSVDGAIIMMFTDWRQLPVMSDALQHGGYVWRNIVTWWKPGIRMQRGRFSGSAEYVVYGSRGVPIAGEKSPQNVIRCAPVSGANKAHIAEKPAGLLRELLSVTAANAIVLDPFMGSGTTLRAAKDLNRKTIGIEIDERSCEVAASRMAQEVLPL